MSFLERFTQQILDNFLSRLLPFDVLQEYIPDSSSDEKGGGATIVVVSLVIEIEGDSTK